jgi:ubiquinone/menaquinone biosynthesis C-methylase UbiE
MPHIDFIQKLHSTTTRDYVKRVVENNKAECAELAKRWDVDYWDGDRSTGYGGMRYDGRWRPIAEAMAEHYGLKSGDRILDVGCGKGFLLYEFTQTTPGVEVSGFDISQYAIDHAKEEVKPFLTRGHCRQLPYEDDSFDVVISLGTLHNLHIFDLWNALKEITRVARGTRNYLMVESYRSEREKANLLYWQLTCESFYTPAEWEWIFQMTGYDGDFGYIYFE